MNVIYDVILRPGSDTESRATGLDGPDVMDHWIAANGTTGDRFRYTSRLSDGTPTASGEGVIDALGEAAYKLG